MDIVVNRRLITRSLRYVIVTLVLSYYEEYPTPHSTQSQHDPGGTNEAEAQNGRPDNLWTSMSID